jgi:hypothetical protein
VTRAAGRCLVLWLALAGTAQAASGDTAHEELTRPAEHSQPDPGKVGFVVLPVPRSDPTLGTGLTLTGLLMYRAEGSTRPWISGAAAMYTDNDSKAAALFQKSYLMHDRLRLSAAVAAFDLNLRFYGIGANAGTRNISIPIEQQGTAVLAKGLYEVAPNIFAGPIVRYISLETIIKVPPPPQLGIAIPPLQLDAVSAGLGIALEYDTRDSELDPTHGTFASVNAVYPRTDLGSDSNYGFLHFAYNRYLPVAPRWILALRASTCSTTGDVPYFDLCLFGMHNDLRGYVGGQYRDRAMYAVQGEARWNFHGRWGAVAFGGTGAVAPSWSEFSGATSLPSYGAGLRFLASKVHKVNISLDWARGRDDDAIYLRIGEAF